MENNDFKGQEILNKEESVVEQEQISTSLNEQTFNQNLTNEQKLEYLSKLIQDAEQNLESNGISKKLVRKDDSLK